MVEWVVGSVLRLRHLVVAAAVAVLAIAVVQVGGSTVDVYPEFDQPAVQVQAEALGLSAQEVEQLITVPLEQDLLNGVPWVEHIRSRSMPGLSAIDLTFEDGTDLYRARQMVQERMTQAKALPNVGTPPIMIQPKASTSRVAMVSMASTSVSLMQMSVLARWQIRPRLMSIPGVANVSIWGQRDRQLQVQVDPERLRQRKVTLTQLIESTGNALWVSPLSFVEASTPGTGGFVETPNQRLGVQHVSPIRTSTELADVAVPAVGGGAQRIGDVATVVEDHQPLIGDSSTSDGPGLMLVVERFPDADTAEVVGDVEDALEAMAPGLSGITMDPTVFRPTSYLTSALGALRTVGLLALLLLVLALMATLMWWRVAVVCLVSVLLSLASAAYVLHLRGLPLTTMTLIGLAAALPVVVDDAVGDVDEVRRRLRAAVARGDGRVAGVVREAVRARRGTLLLAAVVVGLVLAPLLQLDGVTGAFVRPALLGYALAVAASLLVALLATPALAVVLLPDGRAPHITPAERWVDAAMDRALAPRASRPLRGLLAVGLLAAVALPLVPTVRSGSLLPTVQDRDVMVRLSAAPGTSLTEMDRVTSAMAGELRSLAGVRTASVHVGRAIGADELVDVDGAQIWVQLRPDVDHARTLDAVRATVRGYPGLRSSVRGYAEDRVSAAVGAPAEALAVRVYGHDLETLRSTAEDVGALIGTVPGVLAPRVAAQVSRPTVEVEVDLAAVQRNGLRPGDVRREVSTLVSGLTVGSLYEQQKIFDVVVRGGPATRQSVSSLRALLIDTPSGGHVRLGQVAEVRIAPNPDAITHDAVSRSIDVTASVRGRSPADVAREVTQRLRGMAMPAEYRAEVVPDAANQQDDRRTTTVLLGVAVLLALLMLQAFTRGWRPAAVLLAGICVSPVGGLLVAPLVGGARSVGVLSALVAILALATRQSLSLVRAAQRSLAAPDDALTGPAVRGAARELAPSVVQVTLVIAAVLAPAAVLGSTAGLELVHPFAVTALAALVSSTLIVLLVLPALLPRADSPPVAPPRPLRETPDVLSGASS